MRSTAVFSMALACAIVSCLPGSSYSGEDILPQGPTQLPLTARHFPDRLHEFVWWNWNVVEPARLAKLLGASAAAKVQFLSTANVIEFYTLRDRLRDGPPSDHKELLARLSGLADDDLKLAEEMKLYQETEPAIGYQCEIMDYSFSLQLLDEKIRHTRHVLETLARWQKSGVELDVLKRSLPVKPHAARQSTPASPKDPDPLRWGD